MCQVWIVPSLSSLQRRIGLHPEVADLLIGDDTDQADLDLVAELIGHVGSCRYHRHIQLLAVALDRHDDSLLGPNADVAPDVGSKVSTFAPSMAINKVTRHDTRLRQQHCPA